MKLVLAPRDMTQPKLMWHLLLASLWVLAWCVGMVLAWPVIAIVFYRQPFAGWLLADGAKSALERKCREGNALCDELKRRRQGRAR